MDCVGCGSGAVSERPDLTAQGYRRFRCRNCDRQFNERTDGVLNRASLPSDIIAFVVFCRLRYRLTLRDLSEIMLLRGFTGECPENGGTTTQRVRSVGSIADRGNGDAMGVAVDCDRG